MSDSDSLALNGFTEFGSFSLQDISATGSSLSYQSPDDETPTGQDSLKTSNSDSELATCNAAGIPIQNEISTQHDAAPLKQKNEIVLKVGCITSQNDCLETELGKLIQAECTQKTAIAESNPDLRDLSEQVELSKEKSPLSTGKNSGRNCVQEIENENLDSRTTSRSENSITISTQCLASSQMQKIGSENLPFRMHLKQNDFESANSSPSKVVLPSRLALPKASSPVYKGARPSLLDFMQLESMVASGITSPKIPTRFAESPSHTRAGLSVHGKDSSPNTITPKKLDTDESPEKSRKSAKLGKSEQRRRESAQCNAWLSSLPSSGGGRLQQNRLEQLEEDGPSLELADPAPSLDSVRRSPVVHPRTPSQAPAKCTVLPHDQCLAHDGVLHKSAAAAAAAAFLKKSDTPTRMRLPSPRISTEKLWHPPSRSVPPTRPPATTGDPGDATECAELGMLKATIGDGGVPVREVRLSTGRAVALATSAEGLMEQLRHIRILRDDCILSASDYDLLHAAVLAAASSTAQPDEAAAAVPAANTAVQARKAAETPIRVSDVALHGRPPSHPNDLSADAATPLRAGRPIARVPARLSAGSAVAPSTPVCRPLQKQSRPIRETRAGDCGPQWPQPSSRRR